MQKDGKANITARKDYEQQWTKTVNEVHAMTPRASLDSWYMGMI